MHLQLPWSKQWLKDEAAKGGLLPDLGGVNSANSGYSFVDQTAFSSSVTSQDWGGGGVSRQVTDIMAS